MWSRVQQEGGCGQAEEGFQKPQARGMASTTCCFVLFCVFWRVPLILFSIFIIFCSGLCYYYLEYQLHFADLDLFCKSFRRYSGSATSFFLPSSWKLLYCFLLGRAGIFSCSWSHLSQARPSGGEIWTEAEGNIERCSNSQLWLSVRHRGGQGESTCERREHSSTWFS